MNHNQARIDEILTAQHNRVAKKINAFKPQSNLSKLPAGVIVSNNRSRKAYFHPCCTRRKGYLFKATPAEFAKLNRRPLTPEQREVLEDRWLRGVIWLPLLIKIGPTTHQGSPAWEILENPDWSIASFLAEKDWKWLTVQALEMQDVPATKEGLNAFKQGGLIFQSWRPKPRAINIFNLKATF